MAREFTFLNGSNRSEKGIRDLDRLVLDLRGDKLPMHRWHELQQNLGVRYAIIDSWLEAMNSCGFVSTIDGKPTGVTWEERLIVHASRSLSCTPGEVFNKLDVQKKRQGAGIIFSADIHKTARNSVTAEETPSIEVA